MSNRKGSLSGELLKCVYDSLLIFLNLLSFPSNLVTLRLFLLLSSLIDPAS